MNGTIATQRLLAHCALVEAATGLALLCCPLLVVRLLLGDSVGAPPAALGRVTGIALVTLAIACWPGLGSPRGMAGPFRAMLAYNLMVATYFGILGMTGPQPGPLLWPAAAIHAALTLLLAGSGLFRERAL